MTDISFRALFTDAANYRITGTFDGVDLVNGGRHNAVDVGNFSMDDPILSPIAGRAQGLSHWDGALGIRYFLPGGYQLELWHLNATLAPISAVVDVARGAICGRTGNTGALVNGQPMPAHTHIALYTPERIPIDAAPYLLGKDFSPQGDSPMFDPSKVAALYGQQLRALRLANARAEPRADSRLMHTFPNQYEPLYSVAKVKGAAPVNLSDIWYAVWLEIGGKTQIVYLHEVAVQVIPGDSARYEEGYDTAKAAALAAVQAI